MNGFSLFFMENERFDRRISCILYTADTFAKVYAPSQIKIIDDI